MPTTIHSDVFALTSSNGCCVVPVISQMVSLPPVLLIISGFIVAVLADTQEVRGDYSPTLLTDPEPVYRAVPGAASNRGIGCVRIISLRSHDEHNSGIKYISVHNNNL